MTISPSTSNTAIQWQPEKRLSSGDKIWILTDVRTEWLSYYGYSEPQQWSKVGAIDLRTKKIGYFRFGLDDAKAILKAGLPPPPWGGPFWWGIEVKRLGHDGNAEGRYRETVSLVDLEPDVLPLGPLAIRAFHRDCHWSNAEGDMWKHLEERVALELRVEGAALAMPGLFSAGDVKAIVGGDVNVSPHLRRLVEDGRLISSGRKRGTKYQVAPK